MCEEEECVLALLRSPTDQAKFANRPLEVCLPSKHATCEVPLDLISSTTLCCDACTYHFSVIEEDLKGVLVFRALALVSLEHNRDAWLTVLDAVAPCI